MQFPNNVVPNVVPNVEWQEVIQIIPVFFHHKKMTKTNHQSSFKVWGQSVGPGPRTGHTLNLRNDTKLVLFGGRGNNVLREHIPKTYEITRHVC